MKAARSLTSFGPSPASNADRAVDDQPASAEALESRDGRRRRRLLKALAEDHLAVDAAVDLVVHVLDAGTGQMRGHLVQHLVRADVDGDFLRAAGARRDQWQRNEEHRGRNLRSHELIAFLEIRSLAGKPRYLSPGGSPSSAQSVIRYGGEPTAGPQRANGSAGKSASSSRPWASRQAISRRHQSAAAHVGRRAMLEAGTAAWDSLADEAIGPGEPRPRLVATPLLPGRDGHPGGGDGLEWRRVRIGDRFAEERLGPLGGPGPNLGGPECEQGPGPIVRVRGSSRAVVGPLRDPQSFVGAASPGRAPARGA